MLHLHFQSIWTIKDQQVHTTAKHDVQELLFATRLQGGNVIICKDGYLSGNSNNVASKPSLSGVQALKLFQPSIVKGGDKLLWYLLVVTEKNTKTQII